METENRLPTLAAIQSARNQTAVIQRDYRKQRAKDSTARTNKAHAAMRQADPVGFARYRLNQVSVRAERIAQSREGVSDADLLAADRRRSELLLSDTFSCIHCRESFPIGYQRTTDHMTPISRGGKHVASNLAPACRSCNSRKNSRTDWVG